MSSIFPYYDLSLPNHAAEQAEKPYTPPPVEQVQGTSPGRRSESPENRAASDYSPLDAAVLSESARLRAERALEDNRAGTVTGPGFLTAEQVLGLDPEATRQNLALQEFLRTLEPRDNRAAVARYLSWLEIFTRYQSPLNGGGNTLPPISSNRIAATLQYDVPGNYQAPPDTSVLQDKLIEAERLAYLSRENAYYDYLGLSRADNVTREMRENMAVNIDRWYRGEGAFMPQMLWYSDQTGFRFTPVSPRAREATRVQDVLANHNRTQIAAYLRELAGVTPREFLYYDPTGLAELTLAARRDFLARVQTALVNAGVEARAADLRFAFDREEMLRLDLLGLQQERDRLALERYRADLSHYYGQLLDSVRQYGEGIISSSLG